MGVISIAMPKWDRWYFSETLRGARQQVEAAGHEARVHRIPLSETATATATSVLQADFTAQDSIGAVVTGFKYRAGHNTAPTTWERPLVMIGGSALGFPTVMIDDLTAARLATDHLLDLGHTRIAHFTASNEDQASHLILRRRVKGYRTAMERGGLEPVVVEHDLDHASAYIAAHELLQHRNSPTAVFAVSDDIALAVLDAGRDLHFRPGYDLSVVGINDQPEAAQADLTTIRQRPAEMGAAAVDMLLTDLQSGLNPRGSRLHPSSLVKRASTGPNRTG